MSKDSEGLSRHPPSLRFSARMRAWGHVARGPGRAGWGWDRIAGGAASQEGRAGKQAAANLRSG